MCAGNAPVTVAVSSPSSSAIDSAVPVQRTVRGSTAVQPASGEIATASLSVMAAPLLVACRRLASPGAAADWTVPGRGATPAGAGVGGAAWGGPKNGAPAA